MEPQRGKVVGPSAHGTVADSHAVIVMCQRLPKRGQTLWKRDTEMQKDGGQGPRGRGQGLGGDKDPRRAEAEAGDTVPAPLH